MADRILRYEITFPRLEILRIIAVQLQLRMVPWTTAGHSGVMEICIMVRDGGYPCMGQIINDLMKLGFQEETQFLTPYGSTVYFKFTGGS